MPLALALKVGGKEQHVLHSDVFCTVNGKAFVNPLGGSKGLSISVFNFGCWKDKFNISA